MKLAHIVAFDEEYGIGKDGGIPWHDPEDLRNFKRLTDGGVLLMGRKTFESLPCVLPNRTHIVITKNRGFKSKSPDVFVCHNLPDGMRLAREWATETLFIIGGAEIYRQTMTHTAYFYFTRIAGKHSCDTFYPIDEYNKLFEAGCKE